MDYKFNSDGLLSPEDLRSAINLYMETNDKLNLTERMGKIVTDYIHERSIEEIASNLNVTRERIRQILARAQRKIGVKRPPAEVYIYEPMTLEEWIDYRQMEELREQLKTHLKVYGLNNEDNESLTRLFFISLRDYFQDKSFMYEGEGD